MTFRATKIGKDTYFPDHKMVEEAKAANAPIGVWLIRIRLFVPYVILLALVTFCFGISS
jgi:cation transport ATPase